MAFAPVHACGLITRGLCRGGSHLCSFFVIFFEASGLAIGPTALIRSSYEGPFAASSPPDEALSFFAFFFGGSSAMDEIRL